MNKGILSLALAGLLAVPAIPVLAKSHKAVSGVMPTELRSSEMRSNEMGGSAITPATAPSTLSSKHHTKALLSKGHKATTLIKHGKHATTTAKHKKHKKHKKA